MAERGIRLRSLRTRIVLAATAVVGVALVAGALLFGVLLREALLDNVRASAEQDAEEIAARLESPGGLAGLQDADVDDDDRFFQVVSGSGALLAATENSEDAALGGSIARDDDDVRGETAMTLRAEPFACPETTPSTSWRSRTPTTTSRWSPDEARRTRRRPSAPWPACWRRPCPLSSS